LPRALDAQVQARVGAGTPFAVLIREALSAYLADSTPTETPTETPTSADTVRDLQEQLSALSTRVEILEQMPTRRRQGRRQLADRGTDSPPTGADRDADTSVSHADIVPTGADTRVTPEVVAERTHGGQRRLTPLQAAELRGKRAAGMPIKQLMQQYGLSRATVQRYLAAQPGVWPAQGL